jgi:DNA repair protein RadC
MRISEWPAGERPREKLIEHGASALSDAELVAIFLRTGMAGKTAVDVARELLTRCGGLRALLAMDRFQFCQIPGLGPAKYAQLHAALEIGRRFIREELAHRTVLDSPDCTRKFLIAELHGKEHESFACLFLDTRHRVIRFEELYQGTIDHAHVYPRVIVKRALSCNAAAVILAHNHPSGVTQPSAADRELTLRLKEILKVVDIRILDHFIVGDGQSYSFAEHGLL